jgi:O-antigen ligase
MQYATRDTSTYPYQAHNEWLELVLTLGVLGTGWVVALGIGLVRQARRVLREAGGDYPWLLGIACGLAALMMHCLVEFNLHVPGVSLPAALLAGVLVGTKVARARTY